MVTFDKVAAEEGQDERRVGGAEQVADGVNRPICDGGGPLWAALFRGALLQVSALTYCTTITTCLSGVSVTVYQMVKAVRWKTETVGATGR